MIKKLAHDKKEREKRLYEQRRVNVEKMAEEDAQIATEMMKVKEERMHSIRQNE